MKGIIIGAITGLILAGGTLQQAHGEEVTCAYLRSLLQQGYTVQQMEAYARSQGVPEATIHRYKACLR